MIDRGPRATLDAIAGVEGWLTEAQAERLRQAAVTVAPGGLIVEIGSFRGRSTIVLGRAAADGVRIVCIDPHAGSDRGPQEFAADATLGDADFEAFHANLARAGLAQKVRHVRAFSSDPAAVDAVDTSIDVLFVDGAHRLGPALADLRHWGARVRPGGQMLVHDTFSSIGVTLAAARVLWFSRLWRFDGRTGSLAVWHRRPAPPTAPERVINAARHLRHIPWFARNVMIKTLILARLAPLTRLLGHRPSEAPWPY